MDRCYCVFEGGGAKGLAHVGALRALEEAEILPVGFAGTSAGSILAALAAAGYSSKELCSEDQNILQIIDKDRTNTGGATAFRPCAGPTELIGIVGWISILIGKKIIKYAWLFGLVAFLLLSNFVHYLFNTNELCQLFISTIIIISAILLFRYLAKPIAGLDTLRFAINQAISLKLRGDRSVEDVTFAELKERGGLPLKIVSTNISNQQLVLFSAEATPDVAVADAVCASVCIPGIFRPWKIGNSLYYDGGLVSNLPAWVFDSERSIDRDAWTAIVEVGERTSDRDKLSGFAVLGAALQTAIFGAGVLNTRGVERLRSTRLLVQLGLLDFAISWERANGVIEAAKKTCDAELIYQIVNLPRVVENACKLAVSDARSLIDVARSQQSLGKFKGDLRGAIFFPVAGDKLTLQSEFAFGNQEHTDERIRLPITGSLTGKSWSTKEPLFASREMAGGGFARSPNRSLLLEEHRWIRKLLWSEICWTLLVPFYHEPSDVWLVFSLDSDEPLGLDSLEAVLNSLVVQISYVLEHGLPKEAFAWLSKI